MSYRLKDEHLQSESQLLYIINVREVDSNIPVFHYLPPPPSKFQLPLRLLLNSHASARLTSKVRLPRTPILCCSDGHGDGDDGGGTRLHGDGDESHLLHRGDPLRCDQHRAA